MNRRSCHETHVCEGVSACCPVPHPVRVLRLPPTLAVARYSVRLKAQQMALNCNSSLLAIIDAAGALTVLDLEAKVRHRLPLVVRIGSVSAPRPSPGASES